MQVAIPISIRTAPTLAASTTSATATDAKLRGKLGAAKNSDAVLAVVNQYAKFIGGTSDRAMLRTRTDHKNRITEILKRFQKPGQSKNIDAAIREISKLTDSALAQISKIAANGRERAASFANAANGKLSAVRGKSHDFEGVRKFIEQFAEHPIRENSAADSHQVRKAAESAIAWLNRLR